MIYLLIILAVVLLAALLGSAIVVYTRVKIVTTGLLSVASGEFKGAVDRLLETPRDLPDEVLYAIRVMGDTAFASRAPWAVKRLLTADRKNNKQRADEGISAAVKDMRPELQALFETAVHSWMTIMCNRNILAGLMILLEMRKLQVSKGRISHEVEAETMRVLPGLYSAA